VTDLSTRELAALIAAGKQAWVDADAIRVAQAYLEALDALEAVGAIQPQTLLWIRHHGIVFGDIGTDPENWQHVAFSIYSDLCEADSRVRPIIGWPDPVAAGPPDDPADA
jgi:hypothetical protein